MLGGKTILFEDIFFLPSFPSQYRPTQRDNHSSTPICKLRFSSIFLTQQQQRFHFSDAEIGLCDRTSDCGQTIMVTGGMHLYVPHQSIVYDQIPEHLGLPLTHLDVRSNCTYT